MNPPRLRFTFLQEGVAATATLLWDEAPRTCRAVTRHLPFEGQARHGIFSGTEIYLLIPPAVVVEQENATSRVLPGDVAYYRLPGGLLHGWSDPVSEVLWFYDRDARPSMPDGPVPVNLFGKFEGDWGEFVEICRVMQIEGAKPLRIEPEE